MLRIKWEKPFPPLSPDSIWSRAASHQRVPRKSTFVYICTATLTLYRESEKNALEGRPSDPRCRRQTHEKNFSLPRSIRSEPLVTTPCPVPHISRSKGINRGESKSKENAIYRMRRHCPVTDAAFGQCEAWHSSAFAGHDCRRVVEEERQSGKENIKRLKSKKKKNAVSKTTRDRSAECRRIVAQIRS